VTFECSIELPEQEPQDYDVHAEIWPRRPTSWRRHLMEGVTNVTLAASFYGPQQKDQDVSEPGIEKVEIAIRRSEARQRAKDVMPLSASVSVRRRKKALSTKKRQELEPLLPTGITLADLSYIVTQTVPPVPVEPWEDWEYTEEHLVSVKTVGATFRHFLPSSLVQRYDATARQLRRGVQSLLSPWPTRVRRRATNDFLRFIRETISKGAERIPQEVVTSVNDLLRDLRFSHQFEGSTWTEFAKFLGAIPTERRVRQQARELSVLLGYELDDLVPQDSRRFAIEVVPVPQFARAAILALHDFFSQRIKYLGPLRDDPRVIYALPPTPDVPDVGIKGQYTAVVLDRNKKRLVKFIDPITRREKERTLQEAVVAWLQHMGILESVSTEEAGKLGYKLTVRTSGLDLDLDLTTVGVGASQVLPILVMALLASPGTLLIFEQPEIHLHPKVQSLLGDFFLSMGRLGKQCLIETHSEYLVNRLRLRIAEAKDDEILKLVKIYFTERERGASQFREVKPNEYGAILEWPAGFFDEATIQAESIVRLGVEKRKSKSKLTSSEGSS
jgi:predicted ATPase